MLKGMFEQTILACSNWRRKWCCG